MQTDDEAPVTKQEGRNDTSPENVTVRIDKSDASKKSEKKTHIEDPKPRIVLTFRSEKSGAKSSNMKIVSTEEKHEDISPRRSIRTRNTKKESDEDNISHADSDEEEVVDISNTTKRLTRRRSKEFSNVIANAIARKEKSYNEGSSAPTQRLSRKIKPTPKILANEELRMGLESQNNVRMGISADKPSEEGVRTRRSAQVRNVEVSSEKKSNKRKIQEESANESSDKESDDTLKKVNHLCNLGLKIKDEKSSDPDNRKTESSANEELDEDEEIDDDTEVISKLLQADEESASDLEFSPETTNKKRRSKKNSSNAPLRRSSRKANSGVNYFGLLIYSNDSDDSDYEPTRKINRHSEREEGEQSEGETECKVSEQCSPGEEEGSEAACPTETSTVVASCLCEENTNVYAAPSELKDPVFCQAIEVVEGVRVGCSHCAARESGGGLQCMLRAGPRAPYFLACRLHTAQLAKHMCCPTCGLFCTQGIFYQCSKNHLFHLECGIGGDSKQKPGCPHCGVHSYRWQPVNREYVRVQVDMHCSNKRVFLPDQREQSVQAFLGFSSTEPSQLSQDPQIPDDLLPSPPLDLKTLFNKVENEDDMCDYSAEALHEAIISGEPVDKLVPRIVRNKNMNSPVADMEGGTCLHSAAVRGRLSAVCLLRYAGADLDVPDAKMRTPLIRTTLVLLDKEISDEVEHEAQNEEEPSVKKEEQADGNADNELINEEEEKPEVKEESHEDVFKPNDEDLVKVIKYLVAAGCEVNKQGPEGMTALHIAAQYGSEIVCKILIDSGSAEVNVRDQGGWTPLVRAAENKHAGVVRMLLKRGADATISDNEGNLALHWCALAGDAGTLALLLRAAPQSHQAPNNHTDTPLHIAAREGHYQCVVVLLAHGARTDLENSAGELAVDVCTDQCHDAILLNMQMTLAVKDKIPRARIISSDISNGRELLPVPCINDVDDAVLPEDFTYVSHHVMPEHVPIDDTIDTMQGCTCTEECGADCACYVLGVRRWYVQGRLPVAFPYQDPPMLFECNQTCACNQKRCTNRVVGNIETTGSLAVPVEVYRTKKCGWGLRTQRKVLRGSLVALYRGELVPHERADARTDDQYMFALDLKPDLLEQCNESQLCVDACRFGAAARFMNHSCRPTVAPVRVFTTMRDLRLPHVALFALSDLQPHTPLTFDYGDKFWSVKSKWMKCECGVPECRYPTKATEEIDS